MAGVLGINPDPFTLRELDWMLQGRGEFEWSMTSSLMALQINMNCKKKVKPNDFNPFARQIKQNKIMLSPEESMKALKAVFIDKTVWKGNK